MSSISPVSSAAASQLYAPAADNSRAKASASEKADKAAEKSAEKVNELTVTAVAAESIKDSRKGGVLDIRV